MASTTVCIDPSDLESRFGDVTVIDVRTPGEFESIHLPSSINRPLDDLATSVAASTIWPPARLVAGAVGAGLVVAAATNTCAMGMALAKLPHNRPRIARAA